MGTAADIEDEAEYPRSLEAGIDMDFGGDIGIDFGGGRDENVNLDYVGGGKHQVNCCYIHLPQLVSR